MKIGATTKLTAEQRPELLHFDSEFWGTRVGLAHAPDIDKWALANTVGLVFLLVGTDEPEQIRDAEERGYRYTDVRVELERPAAGIVTYAQVPIHEQAAEVIEPLAQLARRAHRITRFYADPRFDRERCDDLYEGWLRNSVSGWAQVVLVAAPALGYCTLHIDGERASIGLIAVDESARGQGIGLALTRDAISVAKAKGAERISVVTQGRNRAALRTFQRAGFLHARTDVWLHRWREDAK